MPESNLPYQQCLIILITVFLDLNYSLTLFNANLLLQLLPLFQLSLMYNCWVIRPRCLLANDLKLLCYWIEVVESRRVVWNYLGLYVGGGTLAKGFHSTLHTELCGIIRNFQGSNWLNQVILKLTVWGRYTFNNTHWKPLHHSLALGENFFTVVFFRVIFSPVTLWGNLLWVIRKLTDRLSSKGVG